MEFTLRRASKIRDTIAQMVNSVTMVRSIDIGEFQNITDQLNNANTIFDQNFQKYFELLTAVTELRKLISHANSTNGVDDILADMAAIKAQISFLETKVLPINERTPVDELTLAQEKLKTRERSMYSASTVSTGILTKEQITSINDQLAGLKKRKNDLDDLLLSANALGKINPSKQVIDILTKYQII